jgi:hypothetical protein
MPNEGTRARVAAVDPAFLEPPPYPRPPMRMLRVYAFDPQASKDLNTAVMNDAVIAIPWEEHWEEQLTAGPSGEYIEVIDHDPVSGLFYAPVDLNHPHLLAQNGLPPSEGRPQFHQQMVFAVAMKTIKLFERALGRSIIWAREVQHESDQAIRDRGHHRSPYHEKKLRIHPHALREANAYYSPEKTALLFGYFKPAEGDRSGDQWVFTCLSQDIVAHETTHAILHGIHRRSIESTNIDILAFHEGFADIVALFQHFTMTEVVAHQISNSRGSLRGDSLLTGLARQFGQAIGRKGSLRYALSILDAQREAEAIDDPDEREAARKSLPTIGEIDEPHERGGYLVAAIFDAFVTMYERRTADLLRIATGSSKPTGAELSPDLVHRLANEAAKASDHILRMCVRALDYIPPVDMHFGEYLRAIITADADLVPQDPLRYRVAIAESFRKCGITVPGCMSMAPDSLVWEAPDATDLPPADKRSGDLFSSLLLKLYLTFAAYKRSNRVQGLSLREQNLEIVEHNEKRVWEWLQQQTDPLWDQLLGIQLLPDSLMPDRPVLKSIAKRSYNGGEPRPVVQVYSTRAARRSGPDGQELNQLVVQIAQKRAAYFDPQEQERADRGEACGEPDFWFRGGSTLLIDLRDGRLRNVVRKRIDYAADDETGRLAEERRFRMGDSGPLAMATYTEVKGQTAPVREPFAMMHRG